MCFIYADIKEVTQLVATCGHKSVREFNKENLRAITIDATAVARVKLVRGLPLYSVR